MLHEGVAAAGVELAENVVHEVERGLAAAGFEELALGELEGEGEGALLTFAGEIGDGEAVQAEVELVAVRADDGLAEAGFALAGEQDGFPQIRAAGREVVEGERLVTAADGALGLGGEGSEPGDEAGAGIHEDGAVLDEDFLVEKDFRIAGAAFLEEEILRTEGAAVAGPRAAVTGIDLGTEEIEVAAAAFTRAADQFEVLVSHPDDESAIGEVGGLTGAVFLVGLQEEAIARMADLALAAPRVAGDAEAFPADAPEGGHAVAAGRVEADENAEGLEDRGFALGIIADEDGTRRWDFNFQRGKAAEIGESQRTEHANQNWGMTESGPEEKGVNRPN